MKKRAHFQLIRRANTNLCPTTTDLLPDRRSGKQALLSPCTVMLLVLNRKFDRKFICWFRLICSQRGIRCRRMLQCCMSHRVMCNCSLDVSTCMSLQIIEEVWKRGVVSPVAAVPGGSTLHLQLPCHYHWATTASALFLKSLAHWNKFLQLALNGIRLN